MSTDESLDGLTFEQAFTRLEDVVRQLEGGQLSLDRAIELYEDGMRLSRHCDEMLRRAQLRVSKLQSDMNAQDAVEASNGNGNGREPDAHGGRFDARTASRGVTPDDWSGHDEWRGSTAVDDPSASRGPSGASRSIGNRTGVGGAQYDDDDDQKNLPW